jgi:peptidoglycan/xylan/chitin deacetylase (PgdA/CDA1 family)
MRYPTILLYHQFEGSNSISALMERTCILKESFIDQILTLKKNGWLFTNLKTLLENLTSKPGPDRRKNLIALTIDDGYQDLLHISDFLFEHKIPATVFICPDYLGKNNLWNTKSSIIKKHLERDEIKILESKGFEFEFHGKDHHRMTKFNQRQLEKRMKTGIKAFSDLLNRNPSIISYPYGSYNDEVIQSICGYFDYGLSVSQGAWFGEENKYTLNRFEVTNWMTTEFLSKILEMPAMERSKFYNEFKFQQTKDIRNSCDAS